MGDFNTNLLNYEKHTLANEFINILFSFHLIHFTLHPTRITDTSSTLIDNIFLSNTTDSHIISGSFLSLISDHRPQFAIVNNSRPVYRNTAHFVYNYSKFDESKFQTDNAQIQAAYNIDHSVSLNVKFEGFLNDFAQTLPKEKLNKKALNLREKPWINMKTRRMI